jgi:hypothetical protein
MTFTLKPGKWKLVRKDGTPEIVESDGTIQVQIEDYVYVFAEPISTVGKTSAQHPSSSAGPA